MPRGVGQCTEECHEMLSVVLMISINKCSINAELTVRLVFLSTLPQGSINFSMHLYLPVTVEKAVRTIGANRESD